MNENEKVAQDALEKALTALQKISKGGDTGVLPEEQGSPSKVGGSTQVFPLKHGDEGEWTRSHLSSQDDGTDPVSAGRTDYVAGVRKALADKIAKGEDLTADELKIFKALYGDMDSDKEDKDEDDKPAKKDKKDVKKSIEDITLGNEEISSQMEVSEFLSQWVKTQVSAQGEAASHVVDSITKSFEDSRKDQAKFNANLAKALGAMTEVLGVLSDRVSHVEKTPAAGPRSAFNVIEKSLGGQAQEAEQAAALPRQTVLDTLESLAKAGEIEDIEVLKFEGSNRLSKNLEAKVRAALKA